jgi:tRNA threonylcarbamoyladenosine biosynthesis protein TsaE
MPWLALSWKYNGEMTEYKELQQTGFGKDKIIVFSDSAKDTLSIGRIIGKQLAGGDVLALIGELGAGKTCLTKGIAQGLDVPACYPVTSPTFTLINEYQGRCILYHMDVFRITGNVNMDEIDYEEYLSGGGVVVIEWAEKIRNLLPKSAIFVYLNYVQHEKRRIEIMGQEDRIAQISNVIKKGGFYI